LTNYNWTIWDKLMPQVISIDFLDYKSTINTRFIFLIYKLWLSNFLDFNLDMVLYHLKFSFKNLIGATFYNFKLSQSLN
jgi:hypothetical protein